MSSTSTASTSTASTSITPTDLDPTSGERADLAEALAAHRRFLRYTVRDLTDEQAARRTTVSQLSLAGLIKHVADVESAWVDFILGGPSAMSDGGDADPDARQAGFPMTEGETLAGLLDRYAEVADRTDDVLAYLPSLDVSHPLPDAPWFPPGATRSARRVLLHIIAETAQHAGHADIIRESLDGAKTMG
jgi:uncharacterized damage-inducible protein DinB